MAKTIIMYVHWGYVVIVLAVQGTHPCSSLSLRLVTCDMYWYGISTLASSQVLVGASFCHIADQQEYCIHPTAVVYTTPADQQCDKKLLPPRPVKRTPVGCQQPQGTTFQPRQ